MPLIALVVNLFLVATWPVVTKRAVVYFDPLTYIVTTLAIGLLVLLPFMGRRRFGRLFEREIRWPLFWMGAFGSAIPSFFFLIAIGYTTPTNAAILNQFEVVYSIILCAILLRERITLRQVAGTALVLAGTGLILGKDFSTPHWKGDLIILGCSWMFQVSHILSKKLPKDVDNVTIAGARMFYAILVLLPMVAGAWVLGQGRAAFAPEAMGLVAFQSVFLGPVNFLFWYMAIRNLDLAKSMAVLMSYPALTMLYSWGLGMEPIGVSQVIGLVLSMSGAIWITLQMRDGASPVEAIPE